MITIPTTAQIYTNTLANLQSSLGITNPIVKKTFLIPIATVWAGLLTIWYKTLGQIQANIWVDTCDDATLLRFGFVILARYPYPAVQAKYNIQVTTTVIGSHIPAGTVFKSDDSSTNPSMLYVLDTNHTMAGYTDYIVVRAMVGGTGSQLAIGDTMTLTAPLTNIGNSASVLSEAVTPVDAETLTDYRAKVIQKIQLIPGSWSAVDYRLIGIEVAGVKQIYAYTDLITANTVDVYVEGETYGAIPSASTLIVNNVNTAITPYVPLGVHTVNYNSCNTNIIAITITSGAFLAFTTAQQTLITNAVVAFINTVRPFIASCDLIQNRNDTISAYNLYSVVSGAVPGYGFTSITFTVDSVPTATYVSDLGNIPFCNSVTFA